MEVAAQLEQEEPLPAPDVLGDVIGQVRANQVVGLGPEQPRSQLGTHGVTTRFS